MANASYANNKFGLDLFHVVCNSKQDSNGFISPFSIFAALSMTQLGARGKTASSMGKALRWDVEDESVMHKQNQKYITLLQTPNQEYVLSTANRLYIEESFSVLPEFLDQTQQFYLAEAVLAQFQFDAENERGRINQWVSEKTQGKIQNLLTTGSVSNDTKMVLVNAIYFKGLWDIPFNQDFTWPKSFKVSDGQTKDVDTMFSLSEYSFWMDDGTEGFSALEIPYKGKQLSMVILLPTNDYGLAEVEKRLSWDLLTSVFSRLQGLSKIKLFLPKFEMTCRYGMKEPLCQLGMSPAFSEADFTGISKTGELLISDVIHKAFVKVNEEGSEAAAATAVIMAPTSAFSPPVIIPEFVVDHPFLFFILDKRASNIILFMGRVVDPSL